MDARFVEVLRLWVAQRHGPVLLMSMDNVPDDVRRSMITVRAGNVHDVRELIARSSAAFFYNPANYLDPAIRDKMLCL